MITIQLIIILIILYSIIILYNYKLIYKNYFKKKIYNVYILLILIFFIIYFFNYKSFEGFDNSSCLVLTYENKIEDISSKNLIYLCEKNNFECKIVGQNKEWNGWYGRTLEYINALNDIDENKYVVLSDGRDVLINEDCESFLKKAINLYSNKKIIFGAERMCCGANGSQNTDELKHFMEEYSSTRTKYDYKYINFGLIFGTSKNVREFLLKLNINPDDVDQGLATLEFYKNPDNYILDYDQIIFNNNNPQDCHLEWDNNKKQFKNTTTGTYPAFLHFPGKGWGCYSKCADMLFKNENVKPIYNYN